jgi:two-component system nitrate/nitrite response regulator NarL
MNQASKTSIVVADDHPIVLHGVSALLGAEQDLTIVARCSDGAAAAESIRNLAPDVAVLDIAMPKLTGLDVLSSVVADGGTTKIVFLTATATDDQLLAAVARGAKGLLLKDTVPDDLVKCIREVIKGGQWLPAEIVDHALEREIGRRVQTERMTHSLTEREREVMRHVAQGVPNKEVAKRLGLSEGTVKIHLHNIYEKVGVPNRTALTALAMAHRDQFTPR